MASLFKRNGSPNWWISFRDKGKRKHRSTRFRYDIGADTRKAREECARLTYEEHKHAAISEDSRFETWVPDFMERRYGGKVRTRERYETAWRNWLLYFDKLGIASPVEITYQHIIGYIKWRRDPKETGVYKCGRNTAIMEIKFLGLVLQEAIRLGFIVTNLARGLGLTKDKPAVKPEITTDEERRIREELPNWPEWMQVAFEISMATGCRLRETVLDFREIDFQSGIIHFTQKGDRPHSTILPPELVPLFKRLKAKGRKTTLDMPARPSKDWRRFFRSLGMPHLCFHCCRVTVVTRLARAGVSERLAMRFVGHASSTIHRVYTRLQVDDLQACVEALRKANRRHCDE